MAQLDPHLGGADWAARMLGLTADLTGHTWVGDDGERSAFMKSIGPGLDAAAEAAAAAAFIDTEAREAGLELLRSAAGQAMTTAEATLLVTSPHTIGVDLWMGKLSDPDQVGDHAKGQLLELQRSRAEDGATGSVSPIVLAELIAATQITSEQATVLRACFATPAGRTWLEARYQLDGPERFRAALGRAKSAGVIAPPPGDDDLLLPRADSGSPSGK